VTTPYDSTADTLRHTLRVAELMSQLTHELLERSLRHDLSKTVPPELDTYNEFVPRLRATRYGTSEQQALVAAMGEGLRHHFAHNRHHPEHFTNGVNDMTLIDLLEMFVDWRAAAERNPRDDDFGRGLELNLRRYAIAPQLGDILTNTARQLGWLDSPAALPATPPADPGPDVPAG
jgi:hypothetical protein